MSISLAVIVIVFADLALVGGVGYVMSQASRLRPHRGETMRRQHEPSIRVATW